MERLRGYINSVCDASQKARNLYMALAEKYNPHYCEKIINESSIFQWTQMWGSTACGFGGIGGAAMTNADCVVIEFNSRFSTYIGIACVYHNGQFAYSCRIDDEYRDLVKKRSMPGQADVKRSKLDLIDAFNREDIQKLKDERKTS